MHNLKDATIAAVAVAVAAFICPCQRFAYSGEEKPLALIEKYSESIRSSEVYYRIDKTILWDADPEEVKAAKGPPKLHRVENPVVFTERYRQVQIGNSRRYERFENSSGKPTEIVVTEPGMERTWNAASLQMVVRQPHLTLGDMGSDYYDSCINLFGWDRAANILGARDNLKFGTGGDAGDTVIESEAARIASGHHTRISFRIELAPQFGMMPRKIIAHEVRGSNRRKMFEKRILDFANAGAGLFAPAKISHDIYDYRDGETSGQVLVRLVTTVDVQKSSWNKTYPADTMNLAIPAGARVIDTMKNVAYVTGKDDPGKHLDDLADAAKVITTAPVADPVLSARGIPMWVYYLAAALLALGVVAFLARLRRSGRG